MAPAPHSGTPAPSILGHFFVNLLDDVGYENRGAESGFSQHVAQLQLDQEHVQEPLLLQVVGGRGQGTLGVFLAVGTLSL